MEHPAEAQDMDLQRIEAMAVSDLWVEQLLDRLPTEQRDAIRARILDNRPYDEIAKQLHISGHAIRKRVSRGLATLRRELEELS